MGSVIKFKSHLTHQYLASHLQLLTSPQLISVVYSCGKVTLNF